ncbi:hypothetical protein [Azospirillum picis]|uniref:Lipoprotein n=1 Tax=Azospirillum picis TaxID=488438 RepID=A0ABU0MVF8_9PROT|nr:hypothetical protein [Azospirillum picis]MBP2303437.1 hypothetical protein [Azospirillum picis]MDQ0537304.1 hypothetical protein [Azospirillum picis]
MSYRYTATLVALMSAVSGCTGTVWTENLDPDRHRLVGEKIEGVYVYPPALFREISETRVAVNEDGKIVGRAENNTCIPIITSKATILPDFQRLQRVFYKPGLLDTSSFGVTLEGGMLTGINSASSPDQGKTVSNVGATVAALATAGVLALTEGREVGACNSGSVIKSYERITMPQ